MNTQNFRIVKNFFIYLILALLVPARADTQSVPLTSLHEFEKIAHPPVKHPIVLSGTFAELRNARFHGGIDIKSSAGQPGDAIFSVFDGYISQIESQGLGYGNLIIINHYNGYQSYYSHLHRFSSSLDSFVLQQQLLRKESEIIIELNENEIPVKAGEIIGYMGNTGHSFGPHLHFEIRSRKSGEQINPLHFGIDIHDKVAPIINGLRLHITDALGEIYASKNIAIVRVGNTYKTRPEVIEIDGVHIGFAIDAIDQMLVGVNKNGIYGLRVWEDDSLHFSFFMDSIPKDYTRFQRAHIDYQEWYKNGRTYHKCYAVSSNPLPVYHRVKNKNGIIALGQEQKKIIIEVFDYSGNISKLETRVKSTNKITLPETWEYNYVIPAFQKSMIRLEGCDFTFTDKSFINNTHLLTTISDDKSYGMMSKVYALSPGNIPVFDNFEIKIDGSHIPDSLRNKVYLAFCGKDKVPHLIDSHWDGDFITGKWDRLGDFFIRLDNRKPVIELRRWNPVRNGSLVFHVTDNTINRNNISFDAYIGDRWIPVIYDKKSNRITYKFTDNLPKRGEKFTLIVRDKNENEAIFTRTF